MPLTKHNVVIEAHRLCQPVKVNSDGEHVPVTLPDRVAQMYLDMSGEWELAAARRRQYRAAAVRRRERACGRRL